MSFFELKAIAINTFFSTNSTYLIISKILIELTNFWLNFQLIILIFVLFNIRNDSSKATILLIFASKKVFLKNWDIFILSVNKNMTINIQ